MSLEELLVRERPRLVAFIARLGAAAKADDILQDAWLKIRAREGRPAPDQPMSFLFRTLHNILLDDHRAASRRSQRDGDWAATTTHMDVFHQMPDSERRVLAIEQIAAVHRLLEEVGDPAALIFRLHRLEGHSQRQIADQLGMGLSTVEKHLRRVYAQLIDMRTQSDTIDPARKA